MAVIASAMRRNAAVTFATVAALCLVAVQRHAGAAVLCKKKKGVVIIRDTTCKAAETLVDPAALGLKGDKGDKGDAGDAGPAGPFPTGDLPSGVTLRGVYRVAGERDASGGLAQTGVTFVFPLATEPSPHYIEVGDPPPAECPGNVSTPAAAAGHLCVYERCSGNATNVSIGNPVTNMAPGSSRFGFAVSAQGLAAGNFSAVGSWAVTAP